MNPLRMTLAEYERLRASLPRGPLGAIWPGGVPPVVIIVPDTAAVVPAELVSAAAAHAARARS